MRPSFLQRYFQSFHRIKGWFQYDAALLFMAFHRLLRESGVSGNVLEIGAYHGLSSIALASLCAPDEKLVVIDPFDDSAAAPTVYGDRAEFERNIAAFFADHAFVQVIPKASGSVTAAELGSGFSFCHIDGGHSRAETAADLALCYEILAPGGLIALDDYFNPVQPGVCEGGVSFFLNNMGALTPLLAAYNKVLFQKPGPASGLIQRFLAAFPALRFESTTMWDSPTIAFADPLRYHLDLYASTPERLVPLGSAGPRILLQPSQTRVQAGPGERVKVPVQVANVSAESTPAGSQVFGMSYRLLDSSGQVVADDNDRTWIETPIGPGESRSLELNLDIPRTTGPFTAEVDLVWEGVMWFREVGNPTANISIEPV